MNINVAFVGALPYPTDQEKVSPAPITVENVCLVSFRATDVDRYAPLI